MTELPLIDLSDYLSGRDCDGVTSRAVAHACESIGFMYVTGHGVPDALLDQVRKDVKAFFKLPLEEKKRWMITRDNYRGYIPRQFFSPNSGGDADDYEGYKLHFEVAADDPIRSDFDLYGPNRWPEHPISLRHSIKSYWQACDRITTALLELLAQSMEIPESLLLPYFEKPLTNMTLLHYPARSKDNTAFGIHPHKDTDALTILAPDPVGGLMVRRRDDTGWIEVDAPPGALVVNLGDMLELWSGGRFVSTPHKVENRSGRSRYSFPYFSVPRYDTVVQPLVSPQPDFKREPVPVGDVSREVWRTNWPDSAQGDNHYDLGTLEN